LAHLLQGGAHRRASQGHRIPAHIHKQAQRILAHILLA
jgi:hypothetical protein